MKDGLKLGLGFGIGIGLVLCALLGAWFALVVRPAEEREQSKTSLGAERARRESSQKSAQLEARQITSALLQYANDYDDRLPPQNLSAAISLSLPGDEKDIFPRFVYEAPAILVSGDTPKGTEVGYQTSYAGREAILAWDDYMWYPDPRLPALATPIAEVR